MLVGGGYAPAGAQTIPPGRETMLAAMLGRGLELPGGCAFTDGHIDREVVRATYRCPYGEVRIALSHPSARPAGALATERFALTVVSGSPHTDLLDAIAARIRSGESAFEWNVLILGKNGASASSVWGIPMWSFAVLLVALAGIASLSAMRTRAVRAPVNGLAACESILVATVVVLWLQIDAAPPAHMDTAVDVALARDCLASGGSSCSGHAASAIGLVQGQGFTYALAVWLYLGLSMAALCLVAAASVGAATGLLHYTVACRFGGVAWVVSAIASSLAVSMTGYPTIWNPSWFVLPLTVAFVATLALARGRGLASAFVAGVAFASTSESHLLFGMFVAAAVLIVLLTGRHAMTSAAVLLASFLLTEIVISPVSSMQNALILRGWVSAHLAPTIGLGLLFGASLPIQVRVRRAIRDDSRHRELVMLLVWLLAGALGLGLVLPWAVSRPQQLRYYGAAFPAIGYALGWMLDGTARRARPASVRVVAGMIFAAVSWSRMTSADSAPPGWLMDDAEKLATSTGLAGTSALDIQLTIRTIPDGAVGPVAAAFVGTATAPAFPTRIVRAVLPLPDVDLPAGWRRLGFPRGEILTSDIDAWTHPEEAEICPEPSHGDPCLTLSPADFEEVARSAGGLLHRVLGLRIARSATRIGEWTTRGARTLLWKIPVRPTGPDEAREFVFDPALGESIVAVDGASWTARADIHAVVERPGPGATAAIRVRTPIADKFEAGIPPLPFELRPGERVLLPHGGNDRAAHRDAPPPVGPRE